MKHPLINKKQNENPTNNPLTTKMQITKPQNPGNTALITQKKHSKFH